MRTDRSVLDFATEYYPSSFGQILLHQREKGPRLLKRTDKKKKERKGRSPLCRGEFRFEEFKPSLFKTGKASVIIILPNGHSEYGKHTLYTFSVCLLDKDKGKGTPFYPHSKFPTEQKQRGRASSPWYPYSQLSKIQHHGDSPLIFSTSVFTLSTLICQSLLDPRDPPHLRIPPTRCFDILHSCCLVLLRSSAAFCCCCWVVCAADPSGYFPALIPGGVISSIHTFVSPSRF